MKKLLQKLSRSSPSSPGALEEFRKSSSGRAKNRQMTINPYERQTREGTKSAKTEE